MYKIHNLTDEESTLLEPAACAIHGLDKLNPPVGIEVLLLGAGPTGLILAQLLKLNGASRVVIAANKGIKMDIAKKINAADEYIELDRKAPEAQWKKLKEDNPYGFDVVVEATGVEKLANESINYVRRGGTLMIYGVYENSALVHWPPSKVGGFIFQWDVRFAYWCTRFSVTKSRCVQYPDCTGINSWLGRLLVPSRKPSVSLEPFLTSTVERSTSRVW